MKTETKITEFKCDRCGHVERLEQPYLADTGRPKPQESKALFINLYSDDVLPELEKLLAKIQQRPEALKQGEIRIHLCPTCTSNFNAFMLDR